MRDAQMTTTWMKRMPLSFEWLIDPVLPTTFFAEFYERKPLLIQRQQPSKFEALLTIEAIDHYLATTTPCHPDVFLVDAARELKSEDFAFPEPPRRIDLPRAYQLFATGATISLSQLHERLPSLADLCRTRGENVQQLISKRTSTFRRPMRRGSRRTSIAMTCSFCRSQDQSCGPCTTPEWLSRSEDRHSIPTGMFLVHRRVNSHCKRAISSTAREASFIRLARRMRRPSTSRWASSERPGLM